VELARPAFCGVLFFMLEGYGLKDVNLERNRDGGRYRVSLIFGRKVVSS
jgi:hypothetical protein